VISNPAASWMMLGLWLCCAGAESAQAPGYSLEGSAERQG